MIIIIIIIIISSWCQHHIVMICCSRIIIYQSTKSNTSIGCSCHPSSSHVIINRKNSLNNLTSLTPSVVWRILTNCIFFDRFGPLFPLNEPKNENGWYSFCLWVCKLEFCCGFPHLLAPLVRRHKQIFEEKNVFLGHPSYNYIVFTYCSNVFFYQH